MSQLALTGHDREVRDCNTSCIGYRGYDAGNCPSLVDHALAVEVIQIDQSLYEGGDSGTFSVWPSEAPNANVTLTLAPGNTAALTLVPSEPLTFSPDEWSEAQAVSVTDNAIIEAAGRPRIDLAASGGRADGATAFVDFSSKYCLGGFPDKSRNDDHSAMTSAVEY